MTLNLLLFLRNRDHLYIGAIVNKSTAEKLQAITHKAAVRIMSAWTMWMEGATANMVGRKDAQGESQDFTCGCPEFHLKDGQGKEGTCMVHVQGSNLVCLQHFLGIWPQQVS